MAIPQIRILVYPQINPFHFSIPQMIFNIKIEDHALFEVKIFSMDAQPVHSEQSMLIFPDGGLELLEDADVMIIPGWDDVNHQPEPALMTALNRAHQQGIKIVGLCYGTYALAYAGLLDGKKASTHWMGEQDFSERFPHIDLDRDALYVEDQGIITSAGTGAGLDCCLYLVRELYNADIANKVSRIMVIPPHREGGQAQFIQQPVATSTQDAQMNLLLDFLRQNLALPHSIESLAARTHLTRRTFTRHFKKASSMTLVDWLNTERIRFSCTLLETTHLSIEKIAERSGFNNSVSFRKKFRETYGTSPQMWRKTFNALDTHAE